MQFSLAKHQTSKPIAVKAGSFVSVAPEAGATARVEYTSATVASIADGSASWAAWPLGTVSALTRDFCATAVHARITTEGGAVAVDVHTPTEASNVPTLAIDGSGNVTGLNAPDGQTITLGGGGAAAGILPDVTASFNVGTTHANQTVPMNSASALVATIQPDATLTLPVGFNVALYRKGLGGASFVAGGGVTIRTAYSLAARNQYSTISAMKIGANEWLVSGDLT